MEQKKIDYKPQTIPSQNILESEDISDLLNMKRKKSFLVIQQEILRRRSLMPTTIDQQTNKAMILSQQFNISQVRNDILTKSTIFQMKNPEKQQNQTFKLLISSNVQINEQDIIKSIQDREKLMSQKYSDESNKYPSNGIIDSIKSIAEENEQQSQEINLNSQPSYILKVSGLKHDENIEEMSEEDSIESQNPSLPIQENKDDKIANNHNISYKLMEIDMRNSSLALPVQILDQGKGALSQSTQTYKKDVISDEYPQSSKIKSQSSSLSKDHQISFTSSNRLIEISDSDQESRPDKHEKSDNTTHLKKGLDIRNLDPKSDEFYQKIFTVLISLGYTDIMKLGNGAFGLVLKVKTSNGENRALKAQVMKQKEQNVEFNFSKILDEQCADTLLGNNLKVYKVHEVLDSLSNMTIIIMELQLAENSLKGWLEDIINKNLQISDDTLYTLNTQLIENLIAMHNQQIVHRDIKPGNILIINNDFLFADFGEAELLSMKVLNIKEKCDSLLLLDFLKGTPRYFAPICREQFINKEKQNQAFFHDLYKCDIYSLGLVLLESLMIKQGIRNKQQIVNVISKPKEAFKYAQENNINHLILGNNKAVFLIEGAFIEGQFPNILEEMLQINEDNRISSVKLAMLMNFEEILISSKFENPFPFMFKPIINFKDQQTMTIHLLYQLRQINYDGQFYQDGNHLIRQGMGRMIKNNKTILEGNWNNDLPNCEKAFLQLFGSKFYYRGSIREGTLDGKGALLMDSGGVETLLHEGYIIKNLFLDWLSNIKLITYQFRINQKRENIVDNIITVTQNRVYCLNQGLFQELLMPYNISFLKNRILFYQDENDIIGAKPNIIFYLNLFKIQISSFTHFQSILNLLDTNNSFDKSHKFFIRIKYFNEEQVKINHIKLLKASVQSKPYIKFVLNFSVTLESNMNYADLLMHIQQERLLSFCMVTYKLIIKDVFNKSPFYDITEEEAQGQIQLFNIEKFLKYTTFLKIINCSQMDNMIFQLIINDIPKTIITKISLDNIPNIQKSGLLILTKQLPLYKCLITLIIRNMSVNKQCFHQIFMNLPKGLRKIQINNSDQISSLFFRQFLIIESGERKFLLNNIEQTNSPKHSSKIGPFTDQSQISSFDKASQIRFVQSQIQINPQTSTQLSQNSFQKQEILKRDFNLNIQSSQQYNPSVRNSIEEDLNIRIKVLDLSKNKIDSWQVLKYIHQSECFVRLISVILDNTNTIFPEKDQEYDFDIKTIFLSISLRGCLELNAMGLMRYLKKVQSIKELTISDLKILENKDFLKNLKQIQDLKHIILHTDLNINSNPFDYISYKLKLLNISFTKINSILIDFNDISNRLRFQVTEQLDSNEDQIKSMLKIFSTRKFLEIRKLDLSGQNGLLVTKEIIQTLATSNYVQNVEYLDISNNELSYDELDILIKSYHLPKLQTLVACNQKCQFDDKMVLKILYYYKNLKNIFIVSPDIQITTINLSNVNLNSYNQKYLEKIKDNEFFDSQILIMISENHINFLQPLKIIKNIRHIKVEVNANNLAKYAFQVGGKFLMQFQNLEKIIDSQLGSQLFSYQIGRYLCFRSDLENRFLVIKDIGHLKILNQTDLTDLEQIMRHLPKSYEEIFNISIIIKFLSEQFLKNLVNTIFCLLISWKIHWIEVKQEDSKCSQAMEDKLIQLASQLSQQQNVHIILITKTDNFVFY